MHQRELTDGAYSVHFQVIKHVDKEQSVQAPSWNILRAVVNRNLAGHTGDDSQEKVGH
jgi:hypothetical protein